MLLDNGAHVMLIHADLVNKLELHHNCLPIPETVDFALPDLKHCTKTTLTEYVKLAVMFLDGLWTAKTVCALVSPDLCTPIILGLPFLVHNNIVSDHATCTCIGKKNSYDLLNPVPPVLPKLRKPRLQEQHHQLHANHKLLLAELKFVLERHLHLLTFEEVNHLTL